MWKQSLIIIKLLKIITCTVLKYFHMRRNVQHAARDDILGNKCTTAMATAHMELASINLRPCNP
jgi:hypothetical protein